MHKLAGPDGTLVDGPRLFTVASVRGILHNSFYAGMIRHRDEVLSGVHDSLVTDEIFQAVQIAMKRNSGRSETLNPRPEREYLLKGLIRCAHCLLPMWAQTYANGHRYYREQKGSRGIGYCVGKSRSMACLVPDEQMGRIIGAIVLPDAWMDRVLSKIHVAGEAERLHQERVQVEQRLKRLGKAYVDGLYSEEDYRREKRSLEEKAIVAIRPKPAFRPLFEIAKTLAGSDVVLIN
ncbi:MAG TPA: recombinase family protein, partial [Dehalococcoidia bacterium]|nr:recombinase family protein [Dehalococcoidia bacterium]